MTMTEHNHFKQVEKFETELVIDTFKFFNKSRLKLLCKIFHDFAYAFTVFATLTRIIKRFENCFVVHSHASKASSLEIEVKFHKLSRPFLLRALFCNF